VPPAAGLVALSERARNCRACPLWRGATQTVFGEGPRTATLLLVGEQPGNAEDLAGRPFVGPAGGLLDRALAEAGIARTEAYVTNVVKHFKWVPKGKLRMHAKPNAREIGACIPWLDAEIALLRPKVLVCLGATAAQALLGSSVRVLRDRGRPMPSRYAPVAFATVHPSSILRSRTDAERESARRQFVADLAVARAALHGGLRPRGNAPIALARRRVTPKAG
jgi:uracil-DNA glycosylase